MKTWRAMAASPPMTLADGDQGLLQDKGTGRGLFRPPHPSAPSRFPDPSSQHQQCFLQCQRRGAWPGPAAVISLGTHLPCHPSPLAVPAWTRPLPPPSLEHQESRSCQLTVRQAPRGALGRAFVHNTNTFVE